VTITLPNDVPLLGESAARSLLAMLFDLADCRDAPPSSSASRSKEPLALAHGQGRPGAA
jgi:hypothetical protein